MTARVTVHPGGAEFEVEADETVFVAARRQGYRWPTICGGKATCTACHMLVLDGAEHLSPPARRESERLEMLGRIVDSRGPWRLACQTSISGDVEVEKAGVRPGVAAGPRQSAR